MSNLITPFSTPPLDDAAERTIGGLAVDIANADHFDTYVRILRQCWTEATEAAAKKCEKRANDRMHERGIYDDTTEEAERMEREPITVEIPEGMRPYLHRMVRMGLFGDSAAEAAIFLIRDGILRDELARAKNRLP